LFLLILGVCSKYRELLSPSIVYCFLQFTDIKQIITSVNPQQYKFPPTTPKIESIVPNTPKDINITEINTQEHYFRQFIEQVNEWLRWFERFLSVFLYVVEWLKNWNVDGAAQLFNDMHTTRDSSSITIIQMKTIVERTLKLLRPFNDLRRLCHVFNCLISFQLIDSGAINNQLDSANYIQELKRFQPTNSCTAAVKMISEYIFEINDRQNVQWYIACEKLPCNIQIKYQTTELHGDTEVLFQKEKVPIDKHVLQGEFETQRAGQLMIIINNETFQAPRTIWYRIKQSPLSTCHLFHGIFNMHYQSYYAQAHGTINEAEFSKLLGRVFAFIDSLLNGTVKLGDMADLKAVFCDKNIHIHEEVKKLFTNRSSEGEANKQRTTMAVPLANIPTDKEIEQVCEWLQIYQYYSHINIIINCIEKFSILPVENDDELIGHLKRLRDENCSLKEITQAYKILKQQFQKLTSQHLQLIKTALECSGVIQMMKKSDLYSPHGRRRFQELRDNLTTQFQLQERNNMILNSWIIAYELCEPFVLKAKSFDEFVDRIARLLNFEENSVKHMQSKIISHYNTFLNFVFLSAFVS
jgi:DNA-binding transcriptional MerR regulator